LQRPSNVLSQPGQETSDGHDVAFGRDRAAYRRDVTFKGLKVQKHTAEIVIRTAGRKTFSPPEKLFAAPRGLYFI
jgi:hypothetical protein